MVADSKLINSFREASRALGLHDAERAEMALLAEVYTDRMRMNIVRQRYYDDNVPVKDIGRETPRDVLRNVDTSVDFAAKAVDMVAARSILDGFTVKGDEAKQAAINELLEESGLTASYEEALVSELTHGCGFWTISVGGEGEPKVVINYNDAMTAAATYDHRRGIIRSGMVVNDLLDLPHGEQVATAVTLYLPESVTHVERKDGFWMVTDRRENPLNVPLMVQMAYRPSKRRPFGKSAISKSVMGITDSYKREIIRMEVHSENHASPMKYALDLSTEAYDSMLADGAGAYTSKMMIFEENANGVSPKIGMLQPAGVDDRLKIQESLAKRFASSTHIPLFALGIETAILTSSEALGAALAPLVTEVESLNRTNGRALVRIAKIAMALNDGKESLSELDEVQNSVHVHWRDPSCPNVSQSADAMLKLASAPGAEFLTQTDFFWEKAGATEEERIRLTADRRRAQAITTRDAILAVNS